MQIETRSRERIAILPNTVACNRPLQHTANGLYSNRIRKSVYKSTRTGCKNILWPTERIKELLGDREQHRGLQISWVFLFLQSNCKIQIAKTRWKSWLRSSRTTRTKNLSFKTSNRRRRSTSSASNRRSCSQPWTTPKYLNYAKHLQNSNALIAIYNGSRHCLLYLRKMLKSIAKVLRRSTRATTMSCQYLAMLSRRTTSAAPDMDLLSDNECITRLKKCCIKPVKKSMENTHPFLRDGITTTNTESRCHKLDGQRSI